MADNNSLLATSSLECLNLWDPETQLLVKKIDITGISAISFLPKNQLLIIGTTHGRLIILSALRGCILGELDLASVKINGISICSSGKNNIVQIWVALSDMSIRCFKIISKNEKITLRTEKTIKLIEEPKSIKIVSNNNVEAQIYASLSDNSIRSYFSISGKERLNFYGHSLPIMAFDLSDDGYVLATLSLDKSLRVWDRDFGNCRRIIGNAHSGGGTTLRILPDTHYCISGGREGLVKFWDLDTFEMVMLFECGFGDSIRTLSVSITGDWFIVGGSNRILRVFKQTKEPIYSAETKEKIREENIITEELQNEKKSKTRENLLKETYELKEAEDIMEILEQLETGDGEQQRMLEDQLLLGKRSIKQNFKSYGGNNPANTFFEKISKIKIQKLPALLVFLHSNHIKTIVSYLEHCIQGRIKINLCCIIFKHIVEHRRTLINSNDQIKLSLLRSSHLIEKYYTLIRNITNQNMATMSVFLRESKILRE